MLKIVVLCAPGLFFGQYLFLRISPEIARVSIGAMVTLIALINVYNHIFKPFVLKKEVVVDAPDTLFKKILRYGCLILGGVVHGALNIGGPLITVYTLNAVEDKEKFRNTMTWVWLILNTMNSISQFSNGVWTPRMWNAYLIAFPMAALGFFFGVRFLNRINKQQFLRFIYVVLLFVGADMFIRNLLVLF